MITFEESLGKLIQLLPDVKIGETDYPLRRTIRGKSSEWAQGLL